MKTSLTFFGQFSKVFRFITCNTGDWYGYNNVPGGIAGPDQVILKSGLTFKKFGTHSLTSILIMI